LKNKWLCITVKLCGNGPVGPSYIPLNHIFHHCVPCQRPGILSATDAVSGLVIAPAANKHEVLSTLHVLLAVVATAASFCLVLLWQHHSARFTTYFV